MNFKQRLLSTQTAVFTCTLFLVIICTQEVKSLPFPATGGVSQVGFSIYRNKDDYDAARQSQNDKVIVTYAVSHPSNTRTGNEGAAPSRNYYDYTQHFSNHQQHQKQIEMFRQEQELQQQNRRSGVGSSYYNYGNTQSAGLTRPAPVIAPVATPARVSAPTVYSSKPNNQAPAASISSVKPIQRNQQQVQRQPEINVGNKDGNGQTYFTNNYLQKPTANILDSPSELLRQQQLVALAKIARSKGETVSKPLDLNEALDASYPVKFY